MEMRQSSADELFAKKKFRRAVQIYIEIIRDEPKNISAYLGAAQCFLALRNFDNAISASNKVIELDRNLAMPHMILAAIHLYQKEYDKALPEASEAYELSPNLHDVANLYGVALLRCGDLEQSILILRKALELHPKSALLHRNLSIAYREKRDPKRYTEEAILSYRNNPSFSSAYRVIAAYQQRYALLLALVVIFSLLGALFLKSSIFLVIPAIIVMQGLLSDFVFIRDDRWRRKGQWKTLLFSIVTDFSLGILTYLLYRVLVSK